MSGYPRSKKKLLDYIIVRIYLRQMMGLHRGPDGPSTAELLARTGQANMADHMRRHRVRWLGHGQAAAFCALHPGPP